MKHLFTFFLLFFSHFVFSQSCDLSDQDYKDYLLAINKGSKVYSLDSIRCNGDTKFFALDRNDDHNVNEALLPGSPGPFFDYYRDSISVQYYNSDQKKNFVKYHNFWNGLDTLEYLQYDSEGRLIVDQNRCDLDCITFISYDENKLLYSYNDQGDLVNEKKLIKWNYNANSKPYDMWVNILETEYEYDNGKLKKEYLQSNYYNEMDDSVRLQLLPYSLKNLSYKNEKLDEVKVDFWDLQKEEWYKYSLVEYSYSGDTIFRVISFWDDSILKWVKDHRQIIIQGSVNDNKTEQSWDKLKKKWINFSRIYYEQSEVEDYWNYFSENWNKSDDEWLLSTKYEYSYAGDTIEERREYNYNGSVRKIQYLYDVHGNLLVYKSFIREEEKFKLLRDIFNNYNSDGILLSNIKTYYVINGKDDTLSYNKEYFWDELLGLDKVMAPNKICIIPNPVDSKLNINTNLDILEVRIFDINGHFLKTSPSTHIQVDDLSPGLYFVKVLSSQMQYASGKFIKI